MKFEADFGLEALHNRRFFLQKRQKTELGKYVHR